MVGIHILLLTSQALLLLGLLWLAVHLAKKLSTALALFQTACDRLSQEYGSENSRHRELVTELASLRNLLVSWYVLQSEHANTVAELRCETARLLQTILVLRRPTQTTVNLTE